MPDHYQAFTTTPIGAFAVKTLGLPNPTPLRRHDPAAPPVPGPVLVGGDGALAEPARAACLRGGAELADPTAAEDPTGPRLGALVFDASSFASAADLAGLRDFFAPVGRRLAATGRVVVLARPPAEAGDPSARVARRAIEGFTRSLGKEIGRGSTVNLVHVAAGAEHRLDSTLRFLLSGRSAYVSGQVIALGTAVADAGPGPVDAPLAGRVALVTGASRGIGAAIARVLHRDGATIVGLDVAQAAADLHEVMEEVGGQRLSLDITAPDAPERVARHLDEHHGGVDVVVHNAGVTRDKKLVNMSAERWASVIDVNLRAPEAITAHLLGAGLIRPNGRVVGVASIAGIAGNAGQTNYAASKAGVIGLVEAYAPVAAGHGVTVNAVAPGFIETQMTAAIPFAVREAGRRMNSLAQGGLPVDVAEAIGWLADPGSHGVTGNVVRVCGQSLLGA